LLSATHGDTAAGSVVDGDVIIGNVTPAWSRLAVSVPAANVRNVFGVDNGETRPGWKTALDATNPVTLTVSTSVAPGTALVFSHRDHAHAITSSSNPGAAASILASTAAGLLTLVNLNLSATSNQLVMQSAGITGTLTWTPTASNKVITLPDVTGTVVLGTGANTWLAYWSATNVLTGSANLTYDGTAVAIRGGVFRAWDTVGATGAVLELRGNATSGDWVALLQPAALTASRSYQLPDVSGIIALGAGTLTVSTANSVAVPEHTHAITSSSNPGAAAAILASTADGYLQLTRIGIGIGAVASIAVSIAPTLSNATAVYGFLSAPLVGISTVLAINTFRIEVAASVAVTNLYQMHIATATLGAGASVGTQIGVAIDNLTTAVSNYGLYIGGANTYAMWVDSGLSRFDGDGTRVFELPADATDPTGGGGAAAGRIPVLIGGVTKYLAYY